MCSRASGVRRKGVLCVASLRTGLSWRDPGDMMRVNLRLRWHGVHAQRYRLCTYNDILHPRADFRTPVYTTCTVCLLLLPLPEKPPIDSPQQHLQPASCSLLVARNTVCRGLPPLHTAPSRALRSFLLESLDSATHPPFLTERPFELSLHLRAAFVR
jgi:hypothetical protein